MSNPAFKQGLVDPFLHVLGLADSYVYDEQTVMGALVIRFTFQDTGENANSFQVLVIEGLEHSYPNGTNHPIVLADYLWQFFRDRTLGGTGALQPHRR